MVYLFMGFRPSNLFQKHECMSTQISNMNRLQQKWTILEKAWFNSLGPKFLLSTHIFSSPGWCPDDVSSLVPPGAGPHHDPHHSHPHQHHQSQNTHQLVRHRGGPPPPPCPHRRFCCRKLTCTFYRGLFTKLVAFWKFCLQDPLAC